MKDIVWVSYTLYRLVKYLFQNLCPMEINFLVGLFMGCLVIGLGLAVVLADPLPAPLKLSLTDQPDFRPRRHGEPLEKRSFDDEGIAIFFLEGSDDVTVDCDDLRYGPTTPGGQAQLTASLLFCIPSTLFISRLVD
ncbi:uncharacterized protein LOC117144783 [Drosophila mauritiana]|uniref:Uncharacterized protein LOC117144783 n=1 Tax=Drosophila mauritiana TaxID=7226 RepID=A0A6P8KB51_DROMA|nr:uncharacterized protein LOC117144783 [Drosophila mauritiana]